MFDSAKIRLTAWYAGVLALTLAVFAALTLLLFSHTLERHTERTLSEVAVVFETTSNREVEDEDKSIGPGQGDDAVRDAAVELGFRDYQVFAFSTEDRPIAATRVGDGDSQVSAETASFQLKNLATRESGQFFDFETKDGTFRALFFTFKVRSQEYQLLAVHPLRAEYELLRQVSYAFLIFVPLALAAASFGGYFLAKKSLAPINEMTRKATEITAKNLHERLPIANERDELGGLAARFNELLSRLDRSFEQQSRFMADASHELRTPVAIIRGESDVILSKKARKESEYRESFEIVLSESERMTRIIEDLFTLARVDSGQKILLKETVFMDEILSDTVRSFRTVADNRKISLDFEAPEEMKFTGDAQFLRRLFSNLIDNAIKHARSSVVVRADRQNDSFRITVSDDGPGVPADARPHIFERFFRADKSRSRDEESAAGHGAGLGLSIAEFIVEAHGGNLSLVRSDSDGSVFLCGFPIRS